MRDVCDGTRRPPDTDTREPGGRSGCLSEAAAAGVTSQSNARNQTFQKFIQERSDNVSNKWTQSRVLWSVQGCCPAQNSQGKEYHGWWVLLLWASETAHDQGQPTLIQVHLDLWLVVADCNHGLPIHRYMRGLAQHVHACVLVGDADHVGSARTGYVHLLQFQRRPINPSNMIIFNETALI